MKPLRIVDEAFTPAGPTIAEMIATGELPKPKRRRRKPRKLIGGLAPLQPVAFGEPDPHLAHWLSMAAPGVFVRSRLPWGALFGWLAVIFIVAAVLAVFS
jgi:hypothetical protein